MDRSRIGVRFSILPRRHKIGACSVAAVIVAAGLLCARYSTQSYASSAVFSYDAAAIGTLVAPQMRQLSAAQLAEAVLKEKIKVSSENAGTEERSVETATADLTHLNLTHLKISELSGSRIRVEWSGENPEESVAVLEKLANSLVNWTASLQRQASQAQSSLDTSSHPATGGQITSANSVANGVNGTRRANGLPDDEETHLSAAISALDSQIQQLEVHLAVMRREGRAVPGVHGSVNDDQARPERLGAQSSGSAKQSSAELANRGSENQQPTATFDAGAQALHQRNEVEEQISKLHKQRAIVFLRLEEILRNKGQAAPVREEPGKKLQTLKKNETYTSGATHGLSQPGITPVTGSAADRTSPAEVTAPVTEEKIFVLQQAPETPYPIHDWRSMSGWLGIGLGLFSGTLYLAVLLWRFRPIHSERMLLDLLPKDVIFICSLENLR